MLRVSTSHLLGYRDIWQRKPVLRALYGDYHRRMAAACRPGRTLEIGGGGGHLKELRDEVLSSDIQPATGLSIRPRTLLRSSRRTTSTTWITVPGESVVS